MGDSTATDSSLNPDSSLNRSAERALIDYLDGLLHDGDDLAAAVGEIITEPEREATPIAADNVRPLADARAARPVRVVEALQTFAEPRPFAEPPRPLRIPLPPIAPPQPVVAPVEALVKMPVQAPAQIPVQIPVETPAVELKQPVVPAAPIAEPSIAETPIFETQAEVDTPAPPSWAANGRPQWAQQPFECLLFKSGGLTLAVPLVELGSIYPLEEGDISEIFGQIEWFLGLMRTKSGNLRVVDSSRVVMPERYQEYMTTGYRFVLSLSHSDWALGIDGIDGTTLLDPDAVRWRSSDRSKRPWLAGTVVEKMCALLDVAQLRWMFDQLDRKRRVR